MPQHSIRFERRFVSGGTMLQMAGQSLSERIRSDLQQMPNKTQLYEKHFYHYQRREIVTAMHQRERTWEILKVEKSCTFDQRT